MAKKEKPKVVIIGASHSGFSSAWLMLNGPASYNSHNSLKLKKWSSFPESLKYQNENCAICNSECICLGSQFQYEEIEFDYGSLPEFSECQIKIIYRSPIRVFYENVNTAKKDGYHNYDKELFPKESSILYGYTGLRGDAKSLYKSIMGGEEKRIQLVEAITAEEQEPYINEADFVIWATGY